MIKMLKHIFGTKMYAISVIPYLFLIRFNSGKTWGINKSIGWAFDLTDLKQYIVFIIISFVLGFVLLHFLKAKTNWILSILFFILISFSSLMNNGHSLQFQLIDISLFLSILIFIIIFIQAIFQKTKQTKS